MTFKRNWNTGNLKREQTALSTLIIRKPFVQTQRGEFESIASLAFGTLNRFILGNLLVLNRRRLLFPLCRWQFFLVIYVLSFFRLTSGLLKVQFLHREPHQRSFVSSFCTTNMGHTAVVPIILQLKVHVRTLQKEEDRKTTKEDH